MRIHKTSIATALILMLAFAGTANAATVNAHGSVQQVYATGLAPKAKVKLLNAKGKVVATKAADSLGGILFRGVKPGNGYRLKTADGQTSDKLTVLSTASAPPSTDVYNQTIAPSGYSYITMRDGTQLAIDVHPPQDVSGALPVGYLPYADTGAHPTLIEYSGYGYADPAGPQNGIAAIANLMGFTVVDVNMRGTGCSGGAFDFFEPLQSLDGYDVVETIARQSWVLHHQVGMFGISYGGISQLFTAATNPPHLAAIAPLSVIDATQTTLYPGGVLNTGFAVEWAKERIHDALPAGPKAGQDWAYKRIQGGDQTCKQNQALHGEAVDLLKKIRQNNHYVPKVADPLAPVTFVHKIHVPVYMACQFEDEQTGGHCETLAEHMTGTDRKWFTFTNGAHVDSLDPETYNRMYDFLSLYVAQQAPSQNAAEVQASAPAVYQAATGINGVTLPPDPIQADPTYDQALKDFQALKPIRILFDNGAGTYPGSSPGWPYPGFEQSFDSFPIPGTKATSWYLGGGGSLGDKAPDKAGADRFAWNAKATPLTDFTGDTAAGSGGLWTASPNWQWKQRPGGSAVSYLTAPLASNTTVIGAGAIKLWVKSSKPNADLQATVTEVRPDGKETFVQNGWLRTNERKLDKKGTQLEPVLSLRAKDVQAMPAKKFVPVTIPLYYEGHAYRAGSRIRITISAPNNDQPIWSFSETSPKGSATVAIAHSPKMPSRLILPVVPGVDVPTGLPPCPGLRNEPCRTYQAITNH
jgi:predicted acyl esterase